MSHTVSEAAARAVKNSQRSKVLETRTPEDIIKTMRNNLTNVLSITKSDIAVLMAAYDAAQAAVIHLGGATAGLLKRAEAAEAQVVDLNAKLEEFRSVYDAENRSTTVKVERFVPEEQ